MSTESRRVWAPREAWIAPPGRSNTSPRTKPSNCWVTQAFCWVAEPLKPLRTSAEFTAEVPLIGV